MRERLQLPWLSGDIGIDEANLYDFAKWNEDDGFAACAEFTRNAQ